MRPTVQEFKKHSWYKDQINGIESEFLRKVLLKCHSKGDGAKEWLQSYKKQFPMKTSKLLRPGTAVK